MSPKRPAGDPPELHGYEFVRLVGSGGFADVFLYAQNLPKRNVAVKVMTEEAAEGQAREQFTAEANLMAQLSSHSSIVSIYHAGTSPDGRPFLVMQYCPLPNLAERTRRRPLGVAESVGIGVRLSGALETAHRAGIVHRDIKPANVLTTEYGRPALTDFGIAGLLSATLTETAGLSIPWAPPEAIDGQVTGVEGDVYSLGATIFTLLVGRSPFTRPGGPNTRLDYTTRIRRDPVPRIEREDLPDSLQRVLDKAMAKQPSQRYSSAADLGRALQMVEQEMRLPMTEIEMPDTSWLAPDPQDRRKAPSAAAREAARRSGDGSDGSGDSSDSARSSSAGSSRPGGSGGARSAGSASGSAASGSAASGSSAPGSSAPGAAAAAVGAAGAAGAAAGAAATSRTSGATTPAQAPPPDPGSRISPPAGQPAAAQQGAGGPYRDPAQGHDQGTRVNAVRQAPQGTQPMGFHAQPMASSPDNAGSSAWDHGGREASFPGAGSPPSAVASPASNPPAPQPGPAGRRRVSSAVVITGVVCVMAVVIALIWAFGTLTSDASGTGGGGGTHTAAEEGAQTIAVPDQVPSPVDLTGTRSGQQVEFTWGVPDELEGQDVSFVWQRTGDGSALQPVEEAVVSLQEPDEVCIEVKIRLTNGRTSNEPATTCVEEEA